MSGREVAEAGLLLVARTPEAIANPHTRQIVGVNRSIFLPALYDSPRYLAWLAAIGPLKAVPSWASVVAFDLGHRVKWHKAAPRRGAGRLLWLCEKMAPAQKADKQVPEMYRWAAEEGVTSPDDWKPEEPPPGTSQAALTAALRDRIGVAVDGDAVTMNGTGSMYEPDTDPATGKTTWQRISTKKGHGSTKGGTIAAFSAKGDCRGTGWLAKFAGLGDT